MSRTSFILFSIIGCLMVVGDAGASRFDYVEQEDPFSEGACWNPVVLSASRGEVLELERLGMRWPRGSLADIVVCDSGFVTFRDDMDLTDSEKSSIRQFLRNIDWLDLGEVGSVPVETLIWLLEEVYKRRDVDAIFWLEFHQIAARLGTMIEGLRRARMFEVFETQYAEFQDDPGIHYLMSGYYARGGLVPEACEALYRGDQIMENEAELGDLERERLFDYRAYAIADLLLSQDARVGRIRISDCKELRKENEYVPDRKVETGNNNGKKPDMHDQW